MFVCLRTPVCALSAVESAWSKTIVAGPFMIRITPFGNSMVDLPASFTAGYYILCLVDAWPVQNAAFRVAPCSCNATTVLSEIREQLSAASVL
jgi:hypothetical protein